MTNAELMELARVQEKLLEAERTYGDEYKAHTETRKELATLRADLASKTAEVTRLRTRIEESAIAEGRRAALCHDSADYEGERLHKWAAGVLRAALAGKDAEIERQRGGEYVAGYQDGWADGEAGVVTSLSPVARAALAEDGGSCTACGGRGYMGDPEIDCAACRGNGGES